MAAGTTETTSAAARDVDLAVTGMTCASCVARVEKKLNKLPGVSASVNLATESAHVSVTSGVTDQDLVDRVAAAGYGATVKTDDAAGDYDTSDPSEARAADLKRRFFVSLVLAVPVMVISMAPALQFTGWQWVVAALALPVATWGAWPFHSAAARAARHGSSTMDTLVSLGVTAATAWSLWALLFGGAGQLGLTMDMSLLPRAAGHGHAPDLYFEAAAMVTTFLLAGRWAESRSRHRAGGALRELLNLGAKDATRLSIAADGTRAERRVPVAQLKVGDLLLVRPGEKIPCDGVVRDGQCAVDAAMVTGESEPVDVAPGDQVTGGTIATSGALTIEATRVGADTMVAHIAKMVADAQAEKAPIQRLADRISAVFVPIVIAISLLTFAGWWAIGSQLAPAFTAAVAVLVIACPCALGLATPTALLVGTGRAAQRGVLVKGPEVLESTRVVDTLVWDKTGTLTEDAMQVRRVVSLTGGDDDVLALAAAVEQSSEHPIARAITERARAERGGLPAAENFQTTAGLGVAADVSGRRVVVGKRGFLAEQGIDVPDIGVLDLPRELAGSTLVWVAAGGRATGAIAVSAPLRPSARSAVAELKELGITSVLLTGDAQEPADAVAHEVGIERVHAGVLPRDKRDVIAELQDEGRVVAMVGDGVNDAAALAQAGVRGLGMAMGSGTDVAIEASDITLMRSDPLAAPLAIRISRKTLRIIKENLFWAFFYNVAAIPLAVAGLLNPMIAGAAMACSSVMVVLNSLRLRRAG